MCKYNLKIELKNSNLVKAISGLFAFTIPVIALIFTSPFIINNIGIESYGVIKITSLLISYLLILDCAYEVVLTQNIVVNSIDKVKLASDSLLVYFSIGILGVIMVIILGYPYSYYWVNIDDSNRLNLYLTVICTGFSFFSLMIFTWNKSVSNGLGN